MSTERRERKAERARAEQRAKSDAARGEITHLLNAAIAVAQLGMRVPGAATGLPATAENLATLAARVRDAVLSQVALGEWRAFGVEAVEQMFELLTSARRGNSLLGEPPIVIEWDFAKTAVPMLRIGATKPQGPRS